MPFLNNIDQLRQVEWGKKFLWDIKFEDAPAPFDQFFPAIDIEEDKAILEHYQFERLSKAFKVPQKTGVKSLRITFADDADNTLVDWLDDWINRLVLNNDGYVSTLERASKLVTLLKLNSTREELNNQQISYWVVPEGQVTYNGSSSSDAQSYSVTFVIVGQVTGKREFGENDFP